MDMVNDGKYIHLDTPQAVKEALASGKDLYNPQTGEFWWEYNYTGSIANTYVHLAKLAEKNGGTEDPTGKDER